MNNNDKCRSNNNSNNVPWAVMIHCVPVKTDNALQNHIVVLLTVYTLQTKSPITLVQVD